MDMSRQAQSAHKTNNAFKDLPIPRRSIQNFSSLAPLFLLLEKPGDGPS
jgi:hypothetical protein